MWRQIVHWITSSIHKNSQLKPWENMLCTEIVSDIQNNLCTQLVLPTCSELAIFMYWTGNSINNLLSYCGLVDAKIRASDIDLPVLFVILWVSWYKNKCFWKRFRYLYLVVFIKVIWNKSKKKIKTKILTIYVLRLFLMLILRTTYTFVSLVFFLLLFCFFLFHACDPTFFRKTCQKTSFIFSRQFGVWEGGRKRKKNVVFSWWAVCEFKECENFKGWDTCSTKLYYFL